MTTISYQTGAARAGRNESDEAPAAGVARRRPPQTRSGAALAYLRRRRGFAIRFLLAGSVLGIALAILLPSKFTAHATFYSEGKSSSSDLSALSGGVGGLGGMGGLGGLGALMTLAGGAGGSQTAFFVDLLKSQAFFDSLQASVIPVSPDGHRMSVQRYVIKREANDTLRRWKARKALKKMIEVSTEPAGLVVVSVEAKSAIAAAAIANRTVDLIDDLNLRFRRDQAAARRKFTESFLADVEGRLSASENQLEDFLLSNRSLMSMRSSSQNPVLQSREERLRSEVTRLRALKQQLESTIENARLTEFNDAPVVTRIDRAPPPEKRSGPPRLLIAIGSVLLSATLLFWLAFLRAPRQQPQ